MRASTEKAQRQLHRLSRRAEDALRQPFAALLASAAKTMGFEDLASTGDGIKAVGVAGTAVEDGQARLAALVLSGPAAGPKRSKWVTVQGQGKATDDAEVGQIPEHSLSHAFVRRTKAQVLPDDLNSCSLHVQSQQERDGLAVRAAQFVTSAGGLS